MMRNRLVMAGPGRPLIVRSALMFAIGLAAAGSGWIQSRGRKAPHPLRVTRVVASDRAPVTAASILRAAAPLQLSQRQITKLRQLSAEQAASEQTLLTAARADATALQASAAVTHTLTVSSTRRIYQRYGETSMALAHTRKRFADRSLTILTPQQRAWMDRGPKTGHPTP